MAKSDTDHAVQLLEMANKDHQALKNMLDTKKFAEEIFGFHAQQVIEKALKAWIAVRSLEYPNARRERPHQDFGASRRESGSIHRPGRLYDLRRAVPLRSV